MSKLTYMLVRDGRPVPDVTAVLTAEQARRYSTPRVRWTPLTEDGVDVLDNMIVEGPDLTIAGAGLTVVCSFDLLNEVTASRLARHMAKGEFGVLSAERSHMSPKQKKEANKKLQARLRQMGYGYIPTKGVYQYQDGNVDSERSYFVPKISREALLKLAKEFDQESVIHGKDGRARGYYQDGREAEWSSDWNDFSFSPKGQARTKYKKREMEFQSKKDGPTNIERLRKDTRTSEPQRRRRDDDGCIWFTTKRGRRVCIQKGETPRQAVNRSIGKVREDHAVRALRRMGNLAETRDPLLSRQIMIRDPRTATRMTLRTWLNRRRAEIKKQSVANRGTAV